MVDSSIEKVKPFEYHIIDNFLSSKDLEEVQKAYERLSFKEISSDLFRFLVSQELNNDEKFDFFKSELSILFKDKISHSNLFYTLSAAYYRKDDFLLCHDDMVDERLWAFAFYLSDHETGKLLMYENDCETLHKAIDVKANRLVIFKVGPTSFHEVQKCHQNGRKTISGWINSPGVENNTVLKSENLLVSKNIDFFDIDLDLENENFFFMEFEDIEANEISRKLVGPFINRRAIEVQYDLIYAPRFSGYELIHSESLIFESDCYILVNDKINMISDENILDVFIFECEEGIDNFLKYIDDSNRIVLQVDALDRHMFIGKRGNCSICIAQPSKLVKFKHFIYKAT